MSLSEKGRTYVLFAIVVLACALGSLTQTVMNSMLGGVEADFGVNASVGQWLTTIYMLMLGITVPAVTFLSQRLSLRNVVFLALGLFLVGGIVDVLARRSGCSFSGACFRPSVRASRFPSCSRSR